MAIALNSIRSPAGGTGSSSVLPLASEPADTTKALVNKPTVQPAGPTTPLPLGSGGNAPALPTPPTVQPETPQAPASQPSTEPVGRSEPMTAAPAPTAPTPYQTNDPLAFSPAPTGSITTDPGLVPPTPAPRFGDPNALTPNDASPWIPDTPINQPGEISVAGVPPGTPAAVPSAPFTPPVTTPPTPITPPPPAVIGAGDYGGAGAPTAGASATPLNATTASNGTVSLTPTTPDNSLTNYTIGVGPTANRFGIAQDLLDQWDANSQPQFDRQIKSLEQSGAARGQMGSGMQRGALADASTNYQTARTTAQKGFLTDALNNSIEDAYRNVGIAQQQQGNQQGQQQQGFNNQVTLQQLQDSEAGQAWTQMYQAAGFNAQQIQQAFTNALSAQKLSDDETGQVFNQAMQQYLVGQSGSPQDILKYLAGHTGTATA